MISRPRQATRKSCQLRRHLATIWLSIAHRDRAQMASTSTQQSIRKELLGLVFDFVKAAGFKSSDVNETLADLVFHLSEYREEDVPYFPQVYLIAGADESAILAALAPGRERVPIGQHSLTQCAAKCLKDCAALADSGWAIYLSLDNSEARYGLFRAIDLPISVSASESLLDPDVETAPVILVRNCAARCVELVDGTGQHLELSLTSAPLSTEAVSAHVSGLATAIVEDVPEPDRKRLHGYFEQALSTAIRASHGSLIAVIPAALLELPSELREGVVLDGPLGFTEPFRTLMSQKDAVSLSQLQSRETLLTGMVSSDGVTVLASDATMRAFRIFVRPTPAEAEQIAKSSFRGGGRTRAFELLKLRLGSPFAAAFFRSQDGRTEFVRKRS